MSQFSTKLYQSQQLRQEMKINPRLYQAMELLYMPLLDLELHLKAEVEENPFLEMTEAMAGMPTQETIPGMPNPIIAEGGVSQPGPWVENQPGSERPLNEAEATRRKAKASPESDHDADLEELKLLEKEKRTLHLQI